ncbi:hypothetical protein Tsubulata_042661 [Turnera subulata]|uniref:DUF4283 domain-containing protein n=1 Tax=Turnera subulata TaxID=218843 RepID=A0A9Q0F1L2_9ROSI|nr:hypothetical protein Tsubulata_042661 [Turnera subulata]
MAGAELNRATDGDQEADQGTLVIRLRPSCDKAPKPSLILVGKLRTEKGFNSKALMQTMSSLWSVKRGLQISELEKNFYMFRFKDERDKNRVLMGEPWHFDRHVVVLQAIEGNEQPSNIDLFQTPFWVQIHDLSFDYCDPEVARMIGKKLGFLMDVYEEEDWEMLSFLRIRVMLDLREPLLKHLDVSVEDGEMFTVLFNLATISQFHNPSHPFPITTIPLKVTPAPIPPNPQSPQIPTISAPPRTNKTRTQKKWKRLARTSLETIKAPTFVFDGLGRRDRIEEHDDKDYEMVTSTKKILTAEAAE